MVGGQFGLAPTPLAAPYFLGDFFQAPFTFHCEVNKNYVNQDGKRQQKNCLKARAKQVVDYLNQMLTRSLKQMLISVDLIKIIEKTNFIFVDNNN